ncbi:UNVERIFIED_CONTAM: hypothetical protein NCL1_19781 [Trichonephila clavipes]
MLRASEHQKRYSIKKRLHGKCVHSIENYLRSMICLTVYYRMIYPSENHLRNPRATGNACEMYNKVEQKYDSLMQCHLNAMENLQECSKQQQTWWKKNSNEKEIDETFGILQAFPDPTSGSTVESILIRSSFLSREVSYAKLSEIKTRQIERPWWPYLQNHLA